MYLKFHEVILVRGNGKTSDPVVYERTLRGERVLTQDSGTSKYATEAKPYGTLYYDTNGQPCVVPFDWSDDDALSARAFVGALNSW